MELHDSYAPYFKWVAYLIIFAFYRFFRDEPEGRPSHPRPGTIANGRAMARTIGGWGRASGRRRRDEPNSTPSPRSHPMWDRDLDS